MIKKIWTQGEGERRSFWKDPNGLHYIHQLHSRHNGDRMCDTNFVGIGLSGSWSLVAYTLNFFFVIRTCHFRAEVEPGLTVSCFLAISGWKRPLKTLFNSRYTITRKHVCCWYFFLHHMTRQVRIFAFVWWIVHVVCTYAQNKVSYTSQYNHLTFYCENKWEKMFLTKSHTEVCS